MKIDEIRSSVYVGLGAHPGDRAKFFVCPEGQPMLGVGLKPEGENFSHLSYQGEIDTNLVKSGELGSMIGDLVFDRISVTAKPADRSDRSKCEESWRLLQKRSSLVLGLGGWWGAPMPRLVCPLEWVADEAEPLVFAVGHQDLMSGMIHINEGIPLIFTPLQITLHLHVCRT